MLQKFAKSCKSLQKSAKVCKKSAKVCKSLQKVAKGCKNLQKVAKRCKRLQNDAKNILQPFAEFQKIGQDQQTHTERTTHPILQKERPHTHSRVYGLFLWTSVRYPPDSAPPPQRTPSY
jgi:hypothetical protein